MLLSIEPDTVVPAPRGQPQRDVVKVRYAAAEPARPTLLVDGLTVGGTAAA